MPINYDDLAKKFGGQDAATNKAAPSVDYDALAAQFGAADSPIKSPSPEGDTWTPAEAPSGFIRGMRDPIDAGAQLLAKITPHQIERGINWLNNWLASKGAPLATLPDGGVDQMVREGEARYQSERANAGATGIDWGRLAGNIASPVNLAAASRIPQAATLGGRVALGASTGAMFGAAQPVANGDFWEEKAKQVGIGAATGGILPAITGGVARVLKPQPRAQVQEMLKLGITPTPGQILGGGFATAEEKMQSLPLLGDAIRSAKGKTLNEFQRAAYQEALTPIGEKAGAEVGREGIAMVRQKLQAKYSELLPKLSFKPDQQFSDDLAKINSMVSTLPPEHGRFFESTLRRELFGRMTPQGNMNGESLKAAESQLGKVAANYSGKGGFEGDIGNAIKEVQAIVRDNLERANPQYAEQLAAVNKGWANYDILRDAAAKQGAKEGIFTPAQLGASVLARAKVGRGAAGKRAASEGSALMQKLSDSAQNVLSSKYPDSGTAGRLALGAAVGTGGAVVAPQALIGAGLASLAYLPGGRQTIAALIAQRPEFFSQLAQEVRNAAPLLTPGAISGASYLNSEN